MGSRSSSRPPTSIVSRAPFFVVILAALVRVGGELPVLVEHHEVGARAAHRVARSSRCSCWCCSRTPAAAAEEAIQEKLNVIAEALSDLMESRAQDDPELDDAVERLREAVGLEERH